MSDLLSVGGSILLLTTPIWFGLLARRKKQSGWLWGLGLAFVSLVVGQFIVSRPLISAFAAGLLVCVVPALIVLAFVPKRSAPASDQLANSDTPSVGQ
jgi:uncharacterized membrane protein HdeD (DUF308 family)